MMNCKISIIVPIYNEEDILFNSIMKNIDVLDKSKIEYEIIMVNDGSKDRSRLIIEDLVLNNSALKVVHHIQNKGFGAAVKTGLLASTYDYIICVPVDSPLDSIIFKSFVDNFNKADVLVSYRVKRLGYNWWMNLNSIIYHFIIKNLFDIDLKDFNWIHAYNRKIFQDGLIKIQYDGIFMLAEVLIKAKEKGFTFIEFPVEQKQRISGVASASKLSIIIKTLIDVIDYYIKSRF